ncbi:alpha-L-fucosidase [Arcticibacter tournemirensis]|uniref:alpha-L-fucosidase n=1 Tax=Arcticibacter tournemirensis TaxID=699437 RepID=A0A4V1KI75_9SPHI|nr:alpha-L-fucosidase [Arcticibacter tournemirensis]RXF69712.1 alpha-L-fucosidase [Arcticibacter tournemirensis]
MYRFLALILFFSFQAGRLFPQQNVHPQSTHYEWPTDPLVKQKLDKWQDQKFGMIIHWGLYAVPGMIESWALCSEDWIERDSTQSYDDFKKWYWGLSKGFNPVKFNPEQWAKAGKDAGMRYLVFTTKHHDGFCMFDTKQTDFSIAKGPFKNNPRADVAKYVFDAFRKQGFMIGAYFSKPDWHTEYYWWPKYATPDRNNNYDIRKHPWRWNQFKQYTYNQIGELMHNYGAVDLLWLDGGWVRPLETVNEEVRSWGAAIPAWSQDIDMPRIASMAREAQPGLLIVDRTVHGPYENYQTPEQKIPEKQLDHPWESCMTLGNAWGYVPNDQYKSASQVIHSLIEVVAKGGSLLLGVGPRADGTIPEQAVSRLEEIGKWTAVNSAAIYQTRSAPVYNDGNTWFTRSRDGKTKYALVCIKESSVLPLVIEWRGNVPAKGSKMVLIESGKAVKWTSVGNKVKLYLPANLVKRLKTAPALAFSFTAVE